MLRSEEVQLPQKLVADVNTCVTQNLHRLNSWVSSLSPAAAMQSEFYRSMRSLIGVFDDTRRTASAVCAVSPFWAAAEIETELANALSPVGHITDVPGLPLAHVLHLAVIWSAVLRLELTRPGANAPAVPHTKMIAQLEHLLQSFADINPCSTLDLLMSSLSDLTDRVSALPLLHSYRITYTPVLQQPPSVRVKITRRA